MPRSFCVLALCVASLPLGCRKAAAPPQTITLATTTSAQDTGLLDVLLPAFEKQTGIHVNVVAVGSGQALELARRGDADILLTHSPEAEQQFMAEGFGAKRVPLMHNDFVIAGPADDPAGIKAESTAAAAFENLAESHSPFVSRADESGTHKKEQSLWKAAGIAPEGDWLIRAGTGMAAALRIANEKHAYILTDRATYLSLRSEVELPVLVEGDEKLLNRYSVITINPAKHAHVQTDAANRLLEFLTSPAGQSLIGSFGVERYGKALFVPDAEGAAAEASQPAGKPESTTTRP